MSLDVDLMVTKPTSVYSANITHNLGKMADAVILEGGLTLYQCLWRPEEVGINHASCLVGYLDEGWNILMSEPETFMKFEPENGWGSYEGLCNFVYQYRNACWDNPDAELRISR